MGAGISGPPNDYPAGRDFDYSLWTAGTRLDLVNVPWNNDYRDAVRFADKTALNTYINGLVSAGIQINNVTYAKPGMDITLGIPFNRVNRFNYLRASNPLMPIEGDIQKDYYYFILGSEYINPQTTRVRLQLDVFQTYIYDVEFGNCYVERGHIGIANENSFNNNGRDYLTVPEGIDLGNEYQVVATRNKWILSLTPTPIGDGSRYPGHDVLVISTTDLSQDGGTADNPSMDSADGTSFQGTTQGAGVWVFDAQQFYFFLSDMKDKPWITQGIISITVIPRFNRYHPDFDYSELTSMGAPATSFFPEQLTHSMFPNWRNSTDYVGYIPERYQHLDKLKTYPYTAIELTTFGATPVIIKPEAWNSANAEVMERAALIPPAQRIEFSPRFHNSRHSSDAELEDLYPILTPYAGMKGDDEGDYIDVVTQIANFPTMTIVNNGQLNYLASNAHGIAFQHQSADWSQQRAIAGAQAGYDVATGAIGSAYTQAQLGTVSDYGQTANQNALMAQQAIFDAIGGGISGSGSGAMFGARGGAAGAVMAGGNAIGGGLGTNAAIAANDQAAALRNNTALANAGINRNQSELARDTNNDLARFVARGDYANTVAGINARVQDAQLIQPSVSGQLGGETMNMVNGGWQVSLRFKMIDIARIRIIGEYWLRYGYAIRAFMKPPLNLKVMSKFSYWKMQETYIIAANIPEGHKQSLRGILEKGVTIWSDPEDIGKIDIADNVPLEGISY